MIALTLGLSIAMSFVTARIWKDTRQIKHQVNEVICIALEREAYYETE